VRIFISYRRADSQTIVGRIYDHLVSAFGWESVFKDVDNIPPGKDFRAVLQEAIVYADVVLVVIGPKWLTLTDDTGQRRLDAPDDFVRIEVASALQRDECRVIPLLVHAAAMPAVAQLPLELRELAFKNASVVRDDPDFRGDMERLIRNLGGETTAIPALTKSVAEPTNPPPTATPDRSAGRATIVAAVITGVLGILAVVIGVILPQFFNPPPTAVPPQPTAVAQVTTAALSPTNTLAPTHTLTLTNPPSTTPVPATATLTARHSNTPVTTATATPTLSPSATFTYTPTSSSTHTPTVRATSTANATRTPLVTASLLAPTVSSAAAFPCTATTNVSNRSQFGHTQPRDDSPTIGFIDPNQTVIVLERQPQGRRVDWYRVTAENGDSIGWVLDQYLILSESCPS
jgi:hypothetical protein